MSTPKPPTAAAPAPDGTAATFGRHAIDFGEQHALRTRTPS